MHEALAFSDEFTPGAGEDALRSGDVPLVAASPLVERVLVIDDDGAARPQLGRAVVRAGCVPIGVSMVDDARTALAGEGIDLVISELFLPDGSGLELLRELAKAPRTPLIIVSRRADERNRILALQFGADDFVVKPFSERELAARIEAIMRRTRTHPSDLEPLRYGDLEIEFRAHVVRRGDREIELTPKEFDLLATLARRPWQACSRRQLLDWVWNSSPDVQDPATVTEHVRRIRRKLRQTIGSSVRIGTVRGIGYRWEFDDPDRSGDAEVDGPIESRGAAEVPAW